MNPFKFCVEIPTSATYNEVEESGALLPRDAGVRRGHIVPAAWEIRGPLPQLSDPQYDLLGPPARLIGFCNVRSSELVLCLKERGNRLQGVLPHNYSGDAGHIFGGQLCSDGAAALAVVFVV